MDFLKLLFGEKALTYAELEQAINAHNGNEANKDNQIKIGNLGGGDYVSKAKHDALQALLDGKDKELTAANGLIEGFKKSQKDNEAVQGQITTYQDQVKQLQAQLVQTQIDSGLKIAFMEAGGTDIDFLIWKAKQSNDGKPLELGEDGKVKGIDDLISGLKTSAPNHFKKANGVKVEENPLPSGKTGSMTRADFMRKPYVERAAFAKESPEAYAELMKN